MLPITVLKIRQQHRIKMKAFLSALKLIYGAMFMYDGEDYYGNWVTLNMRIIVQTSALWINLFPLVCALIASSL